MLTYADVTELGAHACSNCPAKRAPDAQRIFCGCIPGTMAKNEKAATATGAPRTVRARSITTGLTVLPMTSRWRTARLSRPLTALAAHARFGRAHVLCLLALLVLCLLALLSRVLAPVVPRTLFTCFTSTLFTCFTVARARSCRALVLCLLAFLAQKYKY
jgi:hypothetical protein